MQVAERHAPGLPGGQVTTRHPLITEMADSLVRGQVPGQELSTPDMPVRTIPDPIENHPDHLVLQTMLSQAAGEVGMMVLDTYQGQATLFKSVATGVIVGMEIVGDAFRSHRFLRSPTCWLR